MPRFALLFAAAALAVAAGAQEPAADLKAAAGKWTVVRAELGGKDATAFHKGVELHLTPAGGYTVLVGTEKDEGAVTLDPTKTPKQMDIVGKAGPNAGKTMKAIYTLDGDKLVVCYEPGGGDRPTEFKTKAGSKQFLAEYTRAK